MSEAVLEFARLMRRAAEPATPGELVSCAINRAARKLGISRSLAKGYWYGERRRVPADLMDKARSIASEPVVGRARNDLEEFDRRLARLEALLLADEDFHRGSVDALRALAGRPDRTLDGDGR